MLISFSALNIYPGQNVHAHLPDAGFQLLNYTSSCRRCWIEVPLGWRLRLLTTDGRRAGTGEFVLLEASGSFYKVAE